MIFFLIFLCVHGVFVESTSVGLLERFYDLDYDCGDDGDILLDGIPIREIPIESLRSQIALVGQEPVLFARTIAANIMLGARPVIIIYLLFFEFLCSFFSFHCFQKKKK